MIKIFSLLILLNAVSCNKVISNNGIISINFGGGGGFTGVVTSYILTPDGKLKQGNTLIKKLKKENVKEVFEKANALKNYSFNEPDNMSSFLEIKTKEKNQNIVWGLGSTKIDNRVSELFNQLSSLTK